MPVQVLYVGGWMYSGSTLLGRVLGELDGAFAAGEVTRLAGGFVRERTCPCGVPRKKCPVWSKVAAESFGAWGQVDWQRFDDLARRFRLNRRLGATLLAAWGRGPDATAMREFRARLRSLYHGIARVSGCNVIVDTTKSPLYAAILDGIPDVDLRVVHVVRDPRGTLLSSIQRGHPKVGPATSLALWSLSHAAFELGWRTRGPERYHLLRYEDFARRPRETVGELARFADLDDARDPFEGPARITLREPHLISGNETSGKGAGPVEIELDEEWRSVLGPRERLAATALTWPLLIRYGYTTLFGRPRASGVRPPRN